MPYKVGDEVEVEIAREHMPSGKLRRQFGPGVVVDVHTDVDNVEQVIVTLPDGGQRMLPSDSENIRLKSTQEH